MRNGVSLVFRCTVSRNETLSFLCVHFDAGELVSRVRISLGDQAVDSFGAGDVVGFDNFIFGAPRIAQIPEPITLGLLAIGLAGLTVRRRKRIAS